MLAFHTGIGYLYSPLPWPRWLEEGLKRTVGYTQTTAILRRVFSLLRVSTAPLAVRAGSGVEHRTVGYTQTTATPLWVSPEFVSLHRRLSYLGWRNCRVCDARVFSFLLRPWPPTSRTRWVSLGFVCHGSRAFAFVQFSP